jgi:hypothetical protein
LIEGSNQLRLADRRLEFQTPQRNLEDLRVDVGEEVSVQKAEMGLQDQILQMQMQMKMLVASLETSERVQGCCLKMAMRPSN